MELLIANRSKHKEWGKTNLVNMVYLNIYGINLAPECIRSN